MPPRTSLMPPTPTPHKNQALRNRDLFWDHPPNNSFLKRSVAFGVGPPRKNPTVGHCISSTQEMITSLREDVCHGLLLPLLVMVIIKNPTFISILDVSEFSQRHVGSITSAGRSDKRTCMMIADIPSRGAIET